MLSDVIELNSLVDKTLEVSSLVTDKGVEVESELKTYLNLNSSLASKIVQIESIIYMDKWTKWSEQNETF